MVPIVADIFAAIKDGFQEKAIAMIKANERYLSKRDMYKMWIDPRVGVSIKEWVYANCSEKRLINMYVDKQERKKNYIYAPKSNMMVLMRHTSSSAFLHQQMRYAGLCGHSDIAKLLLVHDSFDMTNASDDLQHVFELACVNGYLKIVKLLLVGGIVDPSVNQRNAFQMACKFGHLKIAKLLLACDSVDPADDNNNSFCLASERGHLEIVKPLLACDIGPFSLYVINHAIQGARHNGHSGILELLNGAIRGVS